MQRLDAQKGVITLDARLPAWGMYLLWAHNSHGYGCPVAINRTDAWWIGPDKGAAGDSIAVYGRNLSHQNGTRASWIYLQPAGKTGQWITPTAVNPYRVTFTIPHLATGSYLVWVHNGHGRNYGWSGPLTLTVNNGPEWTDTRFNVKDYGATGDGVTDDAAAITRCMNAAAGRPYSTIYFPAGSYCVSYGFCPPPSNIRWQGAGKTATTIKLKNFTRNGNNAYALFFCDNGLSNVEIRDMTLDANGEGGTLGSLVRFRNGIDLRFTDMVFLAQGLTPMDVNGSDYVYFTDCDVTGAIAFLGHGRQLFINGCHYYGSNDTDAMWLEWARSQISMTDSTGQDLDNSNPMNGAGWAQGRFFTGNEIWGPSRDTYLGDNTSYKLAVRPRYADQNGGEQFMWEGSQTKFSDFSIAATPTTATFATAAHGNLVDDEAVIVAGTGLGQHRVITGYDATSHTITVSPPWNVLPDATSRIDCGFYLINVAAYHNTLQGKSDFPHRVTASAGIEPYGGDIDFIAADNTISQVRTGISSWDIADSSSGASELEPTFFNLYTGNSISDSTNGLAVLGPFWTAGATNNPGIGYFGNSFRRNTLNNLVYDTANNTGGLLAALSSDEPAATGVTFMQTVFEHNSGANMYSGFSSSGMNGQLANTIYYKNNLNRGTGNGLAAVEFGKTAQQSPALRENSWDDFVATYSGTLPGAILEVPYRNITVNGVMHGARATAGMLIWNSGTSPLDWTAIKSTANWLTLSPAAGTINDQNSASTITLTCNPAGLSPGAYTATITLTGAAQSEKVTVTFNVGR